MRLASFFGFDGGGIIVDGISMQASNNNNFSSKFGKATA